MTITCLKQVLDPFFTHMVNILDSMFQDLSQDFDQFIQYYSSTQETIESLVQTIVIKHFSLDLELTERVMSIILI